MTKSGMILVIFSYAQPMIRPKRRSAFYLHSGEASGYLPKTR